MLSTDAAALIDRQPGRAGTVFSNKGGAPVSANTLRRTLDALLDVAGIASGKAASDGTIEKVTSHTFRHTAASWAALGGADPFMLRDTFAWKTLAMTNKYVKRADSGLGLAPNWWRTPSTSTASHRLKSNLSRQGGDDADFYAGKVVGPGRRRRAIPDEAKLYLALSFWAMGAGELEQEAVEDALWIAFDMLA